jgi:hypothetical protein
MRACRNVLQGLRCDREWLDGGGWDFFLQLAAMQEEITNPGSAGDLAGGGGGLVVKRWAGGR